MATPTIALSEGDRTFLRWLAQRIQRAAEVLDDINGSQLFWDGNRRPRSSAIEPETGQGRAPVPEVPAQVQLTDVPHVGLPEREPRVEGHPHP